MQSFTVLVFVAFAMSSNLFKWYDAFHDTLVIPDRLVRVSCGFLGGCVSSSHALKFIHRVLLILKQQSAHTVAHNMFSDKV